MHVSVKHELIGFHQKSRTMWFAILAGIISLIILVVIFHFAELFKDPLVKDLKSMNQLFLFIVFALAFLIIILKRIFFAPSQLVSAARRKAYKQGGGQDTEAKRKTLRYALDRIHTFSLVLWVLADLIVIAGFLSYIFMLSFQTFIIYAVVGLYSLLINYPKYGLLEACYNQIMPGDEES